MPVQDQPEAGLGQLLQESGILDAVLGSAGHRMVPYGDFERTSVIGRRLANGSERTAERIGMDRGTVAIVMIDFPGRVEAEDEHSLLR